MNIQVKPRNRAGKVMITFCVIVSVASGLFLVQDQVIKRQGLVGKWESLKLLSGEKTTMTIAADGSLAMDDKKGTWTYFNGVFTFELEGTDYENKLNFDTPNQLSDHIPDSAFFTKVSS